MTTPPRLTRARHALFLDFDGTLAPLQDDPQTVAMSAPLWRALEVLSEGLGGALAVVSGRDVRDLTARTPSCLWRAGGHGLEICAPGETPPPGPPEAPPELASPLAGFAAERPGVRLERKGPILAVHYRRAPDLAAEVLSAVQGAAAPFPDYAVQSGKMVVEAKPKSANKGAAVRRLMARAPFAGRSPVMAGDDATDEDAFAVVRELGGLAVKVGEGETRASLRLPDTGAVERWLRREAGR